MGRGKEEAPPKKHYELFPENFRTWVFGGTPKYADLKNHQEGTESGKRDVVAEQEGVKRGGNSKDGAHRDVEKALGALPGQPKPLQGLAVLPRKILLASVHSTGPYHGLPRPCHLSTPSKANTFLTY